MNKAERKVIEDAAAAVERWMKVENEVVLTGKRPLVVGSTLKGAAAVRVEAMERRDDLFAQLRAFRALLAAGEGQ